MDGPSNRALRAREEAAPRVSKRAAQPVPRPLKRAEYEIVFISREAEKGWRDCLATTRNACVDAWDRLTRDPTREDERLYRLRADFAQGTYAGVSYDRYQYKISDGGRLWYFVDRFDQRNRTAKTAGRVLLERCLTGHPKETG